MPTDPDQLVTAYGYTNEHSCFDSEGGLTKREHFATMAMQGLLAGTSGHGYHDESLCEASVRIADALIAELNKKK